MMTKISLRSFKCFIFFVFFSSFMTIFSTSFLYSAPLKMNDYKSVLENFVDSKGFVNYQSLKNNKNLSSFLDSVQDYKFEEYSALNKNEKLAFWINLYNATLLDIASKNYPLKSKIYYLFLYSEKSTKNLGDLGKIKVEVFGDKKTLRDIILKIIELDNTGNARAIFALTFLTKDSANLKNSLYNPNLLDRDLDDQVRKFVFDEKNYRLDRKYGILYLSGFFKKYADFFTKKNKNLYGKFTDEENRIITFLLNFVLLDDKEYLEQSYYQVIFKDYDYSLNDNSKKI